jgi:hypothetical protein
MQWIRVPHLLYALVCVGGCDDSGDGEPNSDDPETFAHQYAEAMCELFEACLSTEFQSYYTGMDDCVSYLEDYAIDAGCDFGDDMERDCLDALGDATNECNPDAVSNPDQICAEFLSGCST